MPTPHRFTLQQARALLLAAQGLLDKPAQSVFEMRALHLEATAPQNETLAKGLAGLLRACATWHKTPEVHLLASTTSPTFQAALRAALA